jgi:hypothetical protein
MPKSYLKARGDSYRNQLAKNKACSKGYLISRRIFNGLILATLETMPQLPFEEKVELRPDMLTTAVGPEQTDGSVWISYKIIQTAQRSGVPSIVGPDGIYAMDRVLAATPVRSDLRQADIFLSYSSKDGTQIESLADELEGKHISVWYDRGLIAGQPYRDVLRQRIETVKASDPGTSRRAPSWPRLSASTPIDL